MSNQRNTQLVLLKELRSRFGGRLSKCTAYDGNVCLTQSSSDKPWLLTVVEGSPFSSELRINYRDRKIIMAANETDLRIEVRGELATRILTINREEKAGGFRSTYAGSRRIGNRGYPVYTENGKVSLTQESVLNEAPLAELLDQLGLEENESLHFNNSGIDMYLKSPSLKRCLDAIEHIIDLIVQIEVTPEQLDLHSLPDEFHPLLSYIKKWGFGDDRDREELLENSSAAALSGLVQQVEPYLARIGSYLDSFPDGPADENAAALGRLAESVLEAKQRLAEMGRRKSE